MTGLRLTRSQGVLHAHFVDGDCSRYTVEEGIELNGLIHLPRLLTSAEHADAVPSGREPRVDINECVSVPGPVIRPQALAHLEESRTDITTQPVP
ncbi:hypothetical protein [Gephyromycinifex aptenodytis]|uniref:hypothetical protein n=1 Tax=Gephyromycinifex aptenodytis TaxID=2716227 RepID=UPI0014480A5B|nr:hypothetical protein [Gephyromycinifex aptenodytis]